MTEILLNSASYKDKLYACWLGKNIGGTMGTPYEGTRQINDIQGFVTKPGEVLPNDDLDLQLVWLHAVKTIGMKNITPQTLGEFWMSFISPHWNEYGLGKNNMSHGLPAPLSGDFRNSWRDSNGAWIRTEIWAALTPALPDATIRYAYADASVDHGIGEGTYAAVFVGAVESAAYIVNDLRQLIEIGLSKLPAECRVAKSIRLLLECYDSGMDWKTCRNTIQQANSDIGDGWFEAPTNVAYAFLGMLYGECDFKRSMIIAINCGDDTDCTGATVGSVLGIMGGMAAIPEDWKAYLGDEIITLSCRLGCGMPVPKSCTELTEQVYELTESCLFLNRQNDYTVAMTDGKTSIPTKAFELLYAPEKAARLLDVPMYSYTVDFNFASATIAFNSEPVLKAEETLGVDVILRNNYEAYGNIPYYLTLEWITDDFGWNIVGPKSILLPHFNAHSDGTAKVHYDITSEGELKPINRLILRITADGRPTTGLIPVTILS